MHQTANKWRALRFFSACAHLYPHLFTQFLTILLVRAPFFHHSLLSFSLLLSYIFNPLPFEIISSTLLTSFHPLIFTSLLLVLSISRFFSFLFFPTTNPCGTSPGPFYFRDPPLAMYDIFSWSSV